MQSLTRVVVPMALAAALLSPAVRAKEARVRHVLLISVDGLHQRDLARFIADHPASALSRLSRSGVTWDDARATTPSDSFPGLLAPVTGGTPKSTGVFYDDSYDRTLFAPGTNCQMGPGTETNLAENIDTNQNSIDGGVNASLTGLNSGVAIDPNKLPGQSVNGHCSPVWPHNFVRTNSIFGVIHKHHLRTAWTDKHAAYDIVNGND